MFARATDKILQMLARSLTGCVAGDGDVAVLLRIDLLFSRSNLPAGECFSILVLACSRNR